MFLHLISVQKKGDSQVSLLISSFLFKFSFIDIFWVSNFFSFHDLDAGPPSPASHLRDVFYRMGLNDKVEIIRSLFFYM